MNEELTPLYKEGWICPKCGAVMSPYMPICLYCSHNEANTVNSIAVIDDNTMEKLYNEILEWQFNNLARRFGKKVK